MSEFSELSFNLNPASQPVYWQFSALMDYLQNNMPELLPHFEKLNDAFNTIYGEGERLENLIWTLHKQASHDGYREQVQDALDKLKSVDSQ